MRILVTGGAGMIGSAIVKRWVSKAEVVVVDDLSTGSLDNLDTGGRPFRFIRDKIERVEMDPEQFDRVYHFASPASPDHFGPLWHRVVLSNVNGLMNASRFLVPGGTLVVASSSEVYGQPLGKMSVSEPGRVVSVSERGVYDESKRLIEAISYSLYRQRGARSIICRIFNTYGPGMPDDGRVISEFVKRARMKSELLVHGDGKQTRSFCFVDDLVDQIEGVVRNYDLEIGVFNFGNDKEMMVLDAAHTVAKLWPTRVRTVPSSRPGDPRWRRPVLDETFEVLGGRPKMLSLEEGLRLCV